MARKMHEKRPEEDNRYHDTWKLLKKYRDVTWSLEVSVRQVKNQFRIDYDCSIEDSRLYNSAFIKTSLISYLRQESVHGLFALYFCCREEVFSIGSIYVPVVCT